MASLKFRLRGSSKEATVYLRLSISRNAMFETKTGFVIDSSLWSTTTNFPKQNSSSTRLIYNNLKKLETTVFEKMNLALVNGEDINKEWLQYVVLNCFRKEGQEIVKKEEIYHLTDHVQYMIDNAHTKKVIGKNKLGLSDARIQSYKTFKKNFGDFETKIKKKLKLTDISPAIVESFKTWLITTKSFSINYSGKQLDNLRAVCRDAERLDIPIHPFSAKIESFVEQDEDRHIVTFTPEEIKKIKDKKMPSPYLENAKKWFLLGCEIGQRGGDLLSLSSENLRYVDGHLFIDVIQQKTKKEVTIPIGSPEIRTMLENDFPHSISPQKLNVYIKDVCELAEINEIIEGKLLDGVTNRKKTGEFPKYKLVTSHSFRRTFATNYYKKIATPILMGITGHSKESMFLKYINKQEDKDENAKLFLKYYEQLNKG